LPRRRYLNSATGLGNCFHGDCETKFNKWKFISSSLGIPARDAIEHIKQVAREQGCTRFMESSTSGQGSWRRSATDTSTAATEKRSNRISASAQAVPAL